MAMGWEWEKINGTKTVYYVTLFRDVIKCNLYQFYQESLSVLTAILQVNLG